MIRLIVCSIYSVGFWTVAGIIAAKADTFPVELFFYYTAGLGTTLALMKEKDSKSDRPELEEK